MGLRALEVAIAGFFGVLEVDGFAGYRAGRRGRHAPGLVRASRAPSHHGAGCCRPGAYHVGSAGARQRTVRRRARGLRPPTGEHRVARQARTRPTTEALEPLLRAHL